MERKSINNAFYDSLKEGWFNRVDHPVALLRAENRLRNPWIQEVIQQEFARKVSILDIGCGAGFLTHDLAVSGHEVHGIDLSSESLYWAQAKDTTGSVHYKQGTAYDLPYQRESFDVVLAMDLLEHVEDPKRVCMEAGRVLKKNGLFFFHTFNRTLLSYLLVIKGVELCVSNTPKNMHVYSLFIKPSEMQSMCGEAGMKVDKIHGVRPIFIQKALWKMVFTRKVEEDFAFRFTPSLQTGYSGFARKC